MIFRDLRSLVQRHIDASAEQHEKATKLFEHLIGIMEHVDKLGAVVADLDERLHALDGKRTTMP